MKTITLPLLALAGLAAARHGDNKAGSLQYRCTFSGKYCDATLMEQLLVFLCNDIGGHSLVRIHEDFFEEKRVGMHAICLCAHGDTKERVYNADNGYYPWGTVKLTFGLNTTFGVCQKNG